MSQYLGEVLQEHLLICSLIRVFRQELLPRVGFIQVVACDWRLIDQLTLAGLQDRYQPKWIFLKEPVRFVLQIDVYYFMAEEFKTKKTQK